MSLLTASSGHGIQYKIRGPNSEHEYPEVSPVTSADHKVAIVQQRAAWMRAMGIPDDEIQEYSDLDQYPADLSEETENLKAVEQIKALNLARKRSAAR
jgi:hypothetical protein